MIAFELLSTFVQPLPRLQRRSQTSEHLDAFLFFRAVLGHNRKAPQKYPLLILKLRQFSLPANQQDYGYCLYTQSRNAERKSLSHFSLVHGSAAVPYMINPSLTVEFRPKRPRTIPFLLTPRRKPRERGVL
jgi:hypothetical protein